MTAYIVRRLVATAGVLFGVTLLVFLMLHLTPGDPVAIMIGGQGGYADPQMVENLRRELGLDRPLHEQYLRFLTHALRGDLGRSIRSDAPVIDEVLSRFPATAELAVAALVLSTAIGVGAGVTSAVRQYSVLDYASMVGALVGASLPVFWLGLMLMLLFAVTFPILPVSGRGAPFTEAVAALFQGDASLLGRSLRHLVLPAVALGLSRAAVVARLTRSSMLEVLRQDYVRTARSKGLPEGAVINRHALRNALVPVVTVVGLQFGFLLGGAVIAEAVFAWPGVGRLAVDSILARDYPVVQGCVLLVAAVFVILNLLVDVLYGYLNPRIRFA
ncbi:MAG: ABC transporter permease [Armatimonadota bacterium]|nr:ABC transporter permease [Armatimonadota bacterium]